MARYTYCVMPEYYCAMRHGKHMQKQKIGKIFIDRDLCIGAASCIAVLPDVFELDNENKAVVKNPAAADDETLLLAAQSCPTKAIIVYDEEGNQIYP